jgi:cytidylate kinase
MALYKLKAKRQYGDMPDKYEFQVVSSTIPHPDAKDIEKEIERLGFNKDAQSYRSTGNWDIVKVS